MTDWTTRIDALMAGAPRYDDFETYEEFSDSQNDWNTARLSLAAERLREPHANHCDLQTGHETWDPCNCGKDSDLRRILEGDK